MKKSVARVLPSPFRSPVREMYLALRRLPDAPGVTLHPWRRQSLARLTRLRDSHRGERAFIIGNGPSLKITDLAKLRHEFTFGLNRIYLMFPSLGYSTSCLVSVNDLVNQQCMHELQALSIPRFLSWRSHRYLRAPAGDSDLPIFLYTTYESPKFSGDVRGRVWEGATVTYVALQLAFHMGFQQVILIGVDHSFASNGEANRTITSEGDDRDHFDPNYFGKGFRWQLPDLAMSEVAYRMANDAFRRAGREVLDATIGGKLTVFPKIAYGSLFK